MLSYKFCTDKFFFVSFFVYCFKQPSNSLANFAESSPVVKYFIYPIFYRKQLKKKIVLNNYGLDVF